MNIAPLSVTKTSLTGFSFKTEKELVAKLQANDFTDLYGDFIFIAEGISQNREIVIMFTSAVNANPYFYAIENGRIIHGKSIFMVFSDMKAKKWNWNYNSFYCISNIDHTIANQSLNVDIKRVPAGSILIYYKDDKKETVIPISAPYSYNHTDFREGFQKYIEITTDYFNTDDKYALSLSAGMDSRLMLATLLSKGIRPLTATMGKPEATDVKISARITKDLGLDHRIITLSPDDFLNDSNAREIVIATSGIKSFAHWHTYIYSKKLDLPADHIHLAGANGEIARAYFFDKGILSKVLQHIDLGIFRKFFDLKLKHGNAFVINSVKEKINQDAILDMITHCAKQNNTSDKFDWFYSFERVRNFIATGMALYNLHHRTISPFLDERFVRLSLGLKRKYKLNSIFHKKTIEALYPPLMDYPNSENSKDIKNMDSNFYWLTSQQSVSYQLSNKALDQPFAKALILESPLLAGWTERTEREKLYSTRNYRALATLFMFHHVLSIINEIQQGKIV